MRIQHVYWQVPRSSNPRPAYAVPGLGETLYARGEQVLATAHLCIQSSLCMVMHRGLGSLLKAGLTPLQNCLLILYTAAFLGLFFMSKSSCTLRHQHGLQVWFQETA